MKLAYNGQEKDFSAHLRPARFGQVHLIQWNCSGLTLTRRDSKRFQILFPNEGAFACRTDKSEFVFDGRPIAKVNRPGVVSTTSVRQANGFSLCVPGAALIACAERLTGKAFGLGLLDEAVDQIDLGGHLGDGLSKTAQTAMNEFSKFHQTGLEGLIVTSYEDMLLNLVTCAIFPNVAEEAGHAPQLCGPKAISRIRDYIQAHCTEAMELSLVASRFGLSPRAMQENFRRYYGCSPRDYLFNCRLDNAHRALRFSDRPLKALDVAIRCGFSDYKHFSAKYRDRFLESPSATLRAARR
ncbi:AraC-like DNA-binding protein [Rhodoblastus sphagnicola]|uniref:helix-turn-helix domain-containing protein n=1 Tax=Rhodoblastus sphagnicola TaxID=333368 RepID=UPI0013048034|nr:AraC family transcriptional regulator [Rhodoblastus sphagnicola]MBB4201181.1 AraC-like DNA-binding protein [Rhodoblastus sphagnicola]